jgi:hypothetical protein
MLRNLIIKPHTASPDAITDEIDIAAVATVLVTSEAPDHPIDQVFDLDQGRRGAHWIAGEPGEQMVTLAFAAPQTINQILLEVEQPDFARTQELHLSLPCDGGRTYRELLRQEFNFSPPGTTFEREKWTISVQGVTHLRLVIKPDKGEKSCRAKLTSLVVCREGSPTAEEVR